MVPFKDIIYLPRINHHQCFVVFFFVRKRLIAAMDKAATHHVEFGTKVCKPGRHCLTVTSQVPVITICCYKPRKPAVFKVK